MILKKICQYIGIFLIIISITFTLKNINDDKNANYKSQKILNEIHITNTQNKNTTSTESNEPIIKDMAVQIIDGYDIIGKLTIHDIGVTLPVIKSYSTNNLKYAPCIYQGSYYTNDLIIAGHSYKSHFRNLYKLDKGSTVTLTTVDGLTINYEVINQTIIDGYDVKTMLAGEWDLTLFTCTFDSTSRTTIRLKKC